MRKVLEIIRKIEMSIAIVFLAVIVILVFVAAVIRWFDYPVAWSIDVAQLLFGWVVFLGADVALKNDSHIGVDFLVNKLPFKMRKSVKLINYFLIGLFLLVISAYGFYLSIENFERLFNTLQISYSYATLSVPIGCLLMLITLGIKMTETIKLKEEFTPEKNKAAW